MSGLRDCGRSGEEQIQRPMRVPRPSAYAVLLPLLLVFGRGARAQAPSLLPADPVRSAPRPFSPAPEISPPSAEDAPDLPDSPGSTRRSVVSIARRAFETTGDTPPIVQRGMLPTWKRPESEGFYARLRVQRGRILNPYERFLGTDLIIPMTPRQKAFIAATDVIDLGNLFTITAGSAFFVATNAHSAYGPGFEGFARNVGYSFSLDGIGEFFGTFLIPTVAHQDPRYYRMPHASVPRRILHAVSHTVISRSDEGRPIPNYATLLTYPIGAELANLYIPGLQTNSRSTAIRIGTSLARWTRRDALLGEFLPDISKRIHIRILFVQQIINNMNTGGPRSMKEQTDCS